MAKGKSMILGLLTTVLAISIALTIPSQAQSGYSAESVKVVNSTNFSCTNQECTNIISQFDDNSKIEGLGALSGISANQLFDGGSLEDLIGQIPLDEEQFNQIGDLIKSLIPEVPN